MDEVAYVFSTPGLEGALETEVEALGCDVRHEGDGFLLRGPSGLHRRANLCLRTATRVLLRVASFEASSTGDFQRALRTLDLASYLGKGRVVEVRVIAHQARWANTGTLEASVKAHWKLRGAPEAPWLLFRIEKNVCTVSVDTSGAPLHMRGYRQEVGRAPLRETLAAGCLLYAGYDGSAPLWDLMCGSGTFLIEGALLAMQQAPGLSRRFAFEDWPGHSPEAFEHEKEALEKKARPAARALVGTDLNAGALGVTRRNARRAGVVSSLQLERLDATKLSPPPGLPPGWMVANLPYGKRVGSVSELPELYKRLGAHLKRAFPGWRYAFLAMDVRAPQWLGVSPWKVLPVDNGGLPCRLLLGVWDG